VTDAPDEWIARLLPKQTIKEWKCQDLEDVDQSEKRRGGGARAAQADQDIVFGARQAPAFNERTETVQKVPQDVPLA
jgi:hypothetical protein